MPLLLDLDNFGPDVGNIANKLQQLRLNILETLGLLDRRRGCIGRRRVVNQKDGRLLIGLGREEDQNIVGIVEAFDPVVYPSVPES